MTAYHDFIEKKSPRFVPSGFEIEGITDDAFDYQSDIVKWACKLGKSAIFADTGLGKTLMQTAWADQVAKTTDRPVLILAPLCVAQQTKREADRFGFDASYFRHPIAEYPPIVITNYERLSLFDPSDFSGIVLDESSILKNHTGRTRQALIEAFIDTPYKLSCTATPSPNDYMELGNQAEFLGLMSQSEMLAMYFIHDGGSTQNWRLKGHGQHKFWEWLATWAVFMGKPSDLGYEDTLHDLPDLKYHEHKLSANLLLQGELFPKPVSTLTERREVKRESIEDRVNAVAETVNNSNDPWIIWCDLNDESSELAKAIPDSVEVAGSHKPDDKEKRIMAFTDGDARVLVTKASIAGFGMNWQHCNNMAFVGLNDSYEQFYQAIRRCWRFGQKRPVNVHLFFVEEEWTVLTNLKRKAQQMDDMREAMRRAVADLCVESLKGQSANKTVYNPQMTMEVPTWLAE